MSTATDNATITSVIAAATGQRTQAPFRAVMMKKEPAGWRLVWKTADDGAACDFKAFVDRVLPAAAAPSGNGSAPAGVLGFDCADVAFYRLDLPPVGDQQLPPIVRMQAESLLPLPADRMQVAWRAEPARDGKRRCSVAAARADQLRSLAQDVGARTSRIVLNAEAVVKAWIELFDGTTEKAVLLRMRSHDTGVLLVESGALRHAVTVDLGADDLRSAAAAADLELFVHDVRNALELFDGADLALLPVHVLGADEAVCRPVIEALQQVGITARMSRPVAGRLQYAPTDAAPAGGPVEAADICEYLEPIGLAITALDTGQAPLDLFDGLLASSQKKKRKTPSLVWAAIAAVVAAIACLAAWSAMDHAALTRLSDLELTRLIEQQKTRQLVAANRPDVLAIIAILTENAPAGMLIDNFDFKQGSPVVISSFAKNRDELYEFEKKLDAHADISAVKILNSALDEKQNRINFKMQFNYKTFSGKK